MTDEQQHQHAIEKADVGAEQTPDYYIYPSGVFVIAEVKQLDDNDEDNAKPNSVAGRPIGGPCSLF